MIKNKILYLSLLSTLTLLSSCTKQSSDLADNKIPVTEPVEEEIGGAGALDGKADIKNSAYYREIDFYNSSPTKTLVKLDKFRTYQQTSEWSCGAACVLMVLDYFGEKNISEAALVKEMDVRSPENPREDGSFGATTSSIVDVFKNRGFNVSSSLDHENSDEPFIKSEEEFYKFITSNLNNNTAILIENVEFGGHWRVIIGYDDMGQPENLEAHVVVLADPYDSTDHHQNGYTIQSASRLFGSWFDHNILPENERTQQYVCVSKNNE